MKKKTAQAFKKHLILAGTGLTILASSGTVMVTPAFASSAQTAEGNTGHKAPEVYESKTYRGSGHTIFEVEELSKIAYRVRIVVLDEDTRKPLSGAQVVVKNKATNVVVSPEGSDITDDNGEVVFILDELTDYIFDVIRCTEELQQYETFEKEIHAFDGNYNQTLELLLRKRKKTDPTNPTEPAKPDHGNNGGSSGGNGGNGGGNKGSTEETGGNTTPETEPEEKPSPNPEPGPQPPDNKGNQNPENNGGQKPDGQKPSETTGQEESKSPENKGEYILPGKDGQLGTDDDVRVKPELDADGNDRSYLREDGAVVLPDGGTVTYADGEIKIVPPGTIVLPDGTILYPDEDAVETDAKPHGVHFGDCWFHWLEILAMIVMLLASLRRLFKIRDIHKELDEMDEEEQHMDTKK